MASFLCQSCSIELNTWNGTCPKCGSHRTLQIDSQDTMVGRTVAGKYRIVRKLGQGGMGAVYEGELEGIGQRVALKFLNNSSQMDAKGALRFLNEAKGLARLSSPNAVALHDFGQDEEGRFFIAMEFLEGDDLSKFLGQFGRASPLEAVDIVLQAADALAEAHGKGLIHRDIKPENIMVRRRARGLFVKVLDFGLARLVDDANSRLTNAGTLMGSLRYLSPEQASGRDVDPRTDIYSLGIVLFELVTGKTPFNSSSDLEVLQKHKTEPTPHLNELSPEFDLPELDAVIQRATAKDPNDRFPSMEAFAAALNETVPSLPALSPSAAAAARAASLSGSASRLKPPSQAPAQAPADRGNSSRALGDPPPSAPSALQLVAEPARHDASAPERPRSPSRAEPTPAAPLRQSAEPLRTEFVRSPPYGADEDPAFKPRGDSRSANKPVAAKTVQMEAAPNFDTEDPKRPGPPVALYAGGGTALAVAGVLVALILSHKSTPTTPALGTEMGLDTARAAASTGSTVNGSATGSATGSSTGATSSGGGSTTGGSSTGADGRGAEGLRADTQGTGGSSPPVKPPKRNKLPKSKQNGPKQRAPAEYGVDPFG